jgi:hypothetical protein
MSYVDSHLVPGETVIYETRLHWPGSSRHDRRRADRCESNDKRHTTE